MQSAGPDRTVFSRTLFICLSAAVLALVVLFARMQSTIEAGCGPECVASMQQSLRDVEHQNEMLRRELGRLRIELRSNAEQQSLKEDTNAIR